MGGSLVPSCPCAPREPAELSRETLSVPRVGGIKRTTHQRPPDHASSQVRSDPDYHGYCPSDSGLNIESNIETPSTGRPMGYLVTLTTTMLYISGASRDRTGDLWLAKPALSQLSYGPSLLLPSRR